MAPRNVRDVPAEEFIKAYAAHLKSNDKVQALRWAVHQSGGVGSIGSGAAAACQPEAPRSVQTSVQPPACRRACCECCERETADSHGKDLGQCPWTEQSHSIPGAAESVCTGLVEQYQSLKRLSVLCKSSGATETEAGLQNVSF